MAEPEIDGLFKQWQRGNELAFNVIMDYYYPRLMASSLQMVHNREDAEELVMNAILKLWQHKNRLSDVLKLDGYLFGILRQEIAGRSRKRVIAQVDIEEVALNELGSIEHPEFTLQELQAKYQAALDKLTPKQREIFLFSREQDMTQQEIAEKTGLSVHTVSNHMTAALKVFREEMIEYPETLLLVLLTSPYTVPFFC